MLDGLVEFSTARQFNSEVVMLHSGFGVLSSLLVAPRKSTNGRNHNYAHNAC
jgi:hypothetical protein